MGEDFVNFAFQPSFIRESQPEFANGRATRAAIEKMLGTPVPPQVSLEAEFDQVRQRASEIAARLFKKLPGGALSTIIIDAEDVD